MTDSALPNFRFYARAMIFDKTKERVLLLKKRSNQIIGSGAWLLPGGTVEFAEDIESALIREIQEETNLRVRSLELLVTKKMLLQQTHWLGMYYLAEVVDERDLRNAEDTKHETAEFVPLKDVPDLRDYTVLQFVKNIHSNREYFDSRYCVPGEHSMGEALERYVSMKMHHLIHADHKSISKVRVIGNYDRSAHVSKDEKKGKLFNFKRPTVFLDGDTLYLCCFPGRDYIRHYANLIATFFKILEEPKIVSYIFPGDDQIFQTFDHTNLRAIPRADVVIFGNVERLGLSDDGPFEGSGDFLWKCEMIGTRKVLFLGCRFSIWGDVGYSLVKALSRFHNFKTFIYVGKLGSLDAALLPNTSIATGSRSVINGQAIEWENIFEGRCKGNKRVIIGNHVTCGSVIDETKENIHRFQQIGVFIDPEIGHMARACNELGLKFSYLHLISDNVARPHLENLSNERDLNIPEKRSELFYEIGRIIRNSLS